MREKQGLPQKNSSGYRQYSPSKLQSAFKCVVEDRISVAKAAKIYGVPDSTLRDRVDGHIHMDCTKSGPKPILNEYEEARLVEHIKYLASIGYGYTRQQVIDKQTEYGRTENKITKPLSTKWFYGFMRRWPSLKVTKPSGLSVARAKGSNPEVINKYYEELNSVMSKYNLHNSPVNIYNIDEKGISAEHSPPYVVSGCEIRTPQALTSPRVTVTIIGCGNALGTALPPYFVFPGQRMRSELLQNATPGTAATMSPSGWSNTEIFKKYLSEHFVSYAQGSGEYKLVMYDGHKSHTHPSIIDWARQNKIILFVLPPHTSQILQPLDIGCFGPLQKVYNYEVQKYLRSNPGEIISRYEVAMLACSAYRKALCPSNLVSSFRKSGIYPFDNQAFDQTKIITHKVFHSQMSEGETPEEKDDNIVNPIDNFIANIERNVIAPPKVVKERNTLSKITSGRAITEDSITAAVQQHVEKYDPKEKKGGTKKSQKRTKAMPILNTPKKNQMLSKNPQSVLPTNTSLPNSPQAGPSHVNLSSPTITHSDSEDEDPADLCCICKKFSPTAFKKQRGRAVCFVNWAMCDQCGHWTHLKFCSKIVRVSPVDQFQCPHCNPDTAIQEE